MHDKDRALSKAGGWASPKEDKRARQAVDSKKSFLGFPCHFYRESVRSQQELTPSSGTGPSEVRDLSPAMPRSLGTRAGN